MATLGKAQGIFDLENSDMCVGSFLSKKDVHTKKGLDSRGRYDNRIKKGDELYWLKIYKKNEKRLLSQ